MPSKSEILSHAMSLEGHCWAQEQEPEGDKVWSGKEHGAAFELSKPEGVVFKDDTSNLLLALRGKIEGKEQLKRDFVTVFGEPEVEMPAKRFSHPQLLFWNTKKALIPQSK